MVFDIKLLYDLNRIVVGQSVKSVALTSYALERKRNSGLNN